MNATRETHPKLLDRANDLLGVLGRTDGSCEEHSDELGAAGLESHVDDAGTSTTEASGSFLRGGKEDGTHVSGLGVQMVST